VPVIKCGAYPVPPVTVDLDLESNQPNLILLSPSTPCPHLLSYLYFYYIMMAQIPLTTVNSILAVVHLANVLLPDVRTSSITHMGLNVAGMDMLDCWFSAMPVCHGSGDLAAQYRFDARSGASIIFLGILKLTVGFLFGDSLIDL
jgi:hypothetical protein